jgi:intracellular sulfur oxidation DsrE/DsrF family protein
MRKDSHFSNETIHAFVDGELSAQESAELLQAASLSDELKGRICDAQYVKVSVQAAYPVPDQVEEPLGRPDRRRFIGHLAATAAGGFGVFLGMRMMGGASFTESLDSGQDGVLAGGQARVVFHISSDDLELAEQLFSQVELVLQEFSSRGKAIRVNVVANNQGLRLLQSGRSPFGERIRTMHEKYDNLLFAACGNTMERFRKEYGEEIEVLPEAIVIRSGVTFVSRRQRQGWSYIKV